MRKVRMTTVLLFLFAAGIAGNASALDTRAVSVSRSPLNKIIRGLVNVATCIVELPASVVDVSRQKGPVKGATLGLADGVATTFVRLGTGLFDVVTFLVPPYDKPILRPEYALESAKEKIMIQEW